MRLPRDWWVVALALAAVAAVAAAVVAVLTRRKEGYEAQWRCPGSGTYKWAANGWCCRNYTDSLGPNCRPPVRTTAYRCPAGKKFNDDNGQCCEDYDSDEECVQPLISVDNARDGGQTRWIDDPERWSPDCDESFRLEWQVDPRRKQPPYSAKQCQEAWQARGGRTSVCLRGKDGFPWCAGVRNGEIGWRKRLGQEFEEDVAQRLQ